MNGGINTGPLKLQPTLLRSHTMEASMDSDIAQRDQVWVNSLTLRTLFFPFKAIQPSVPSRLNCPRAGSIGILRSDIWDILEMDLNKTPRQIITSLNTTEKKIPEHNKRKRGQIAPRATEPTIDIEKRRIKKAPGKPTNLNKISEKAPSVPLNPQSHITGEPHVT